ncbi:MAG TPA: RHS repeat-associated core domain-containing protein [Bacteroidales bacterium]|nr:RHS repeat-associated core domain-containing protein [Bacteroidales bacterium]HXK90898.1 RHS repeat-associated core domain-containing protein [Bacteroidales bacterium]
MRYKYLQNIKYIFKINLFVSQRNTELDIESNYTYIGALYYDSELSGWLSVDPMSDKYPSLSPYCYTADNPMVLVDPNGMLITDYYDIKTSEHLEHIDDVIVEAIAIKNIVYDVLENRSNVSEKSINEINKSTAIYGYGSKNYNIALSEGKGYNANEYSISRHNAARKGAMMGMLNRNNKLDYSQGAYLGEDSIYLENPTKYNTNFFNKLGHGTTIGSSSNKNTFSYTTEIGGTQFMKYNQDLYPKKTWP